ncbi:MAG: molybdopterin-dependent oxidoreductase [Pseudomonadota bacterium]|nr:molybdopterin-dependent oxidoreductase [Pseudomonadota bacterium]
MSARLTRRTLIVGASAVAGAAALGAFTLGFRLRPPGAPPAPAGEINAWLTIHPDEAVLIRISRAEMGQGAATGLAQLLAEELDCDWRHVRTEFARPGDSLARGGVYGDFQTGGSASIRELHETMRQAGATARQMLVTAAAERWGVSPQDCVTAAGVVSHPPSGRALPYGQLAAAAMAVPVPPSVPLKAPAEWKLIGAPLPRLEAREKVTGQTRFGIDVKLPGMLAAAVRMCPQVGGTLQGFDASAVAALPGVRQVVRVDERTVAVIADTWWRAESAIGQLPIVWADGPHKDVSSDGIAQMLDAGLGAEDAFVGFSAGDAPGTLRAAARAVRADYAFPYQAHAALEPINATARWTPERCEVWASTQDAGDMLHVVAAASGLPPGQCEVHPSYLGGAFGRRLYSEFARMAVLIARQVPGTPVQMIWSRAEDATHDFYHPTTRARLSGALDANGRLSALHVRVSGQSIRATHAPARLVGNGDPHMLNGLRPSGYGVPNVLVDLSMRNPPIPPGSWRGVHANQNFFYLESFIDEMAHAAGRDPWAFRRELLAGNPRLLGVLDAVARHMGWGQPTPGKGRGLACATVTGSDVALAMEVSVANGQIKIHRMVCAIDCGTAVNPALIARQLEGGAAFGLSAALHGECTVAGGAIEQRNFGDYALLRMTEMPPVETIVMPSGGFWGGVGEPPVVVVAPALMNALFAATGQRIRSLPLKNHKLA